MLMFNKPIKTGFEKNSKKKKKKKKIYLTRNAHV